MANIGELTIDIKVKGLDAPLLIIVDETRHVHIFEHGKKIAARKIDFHAEVDEIPVVTIEKYVVKG